MIKTFNWQMILLLVLASGLIMACQSGFKQSGSVELQNAEVIVSGKIITANTGVVTRVWELSDLGLSTIDMETIQGENLVTEQQNVNDWHFPWMKNESEAILISIENKVDNDEGFLNNFIRTTIEFHYPISKIGLIYDIWTMPNAPGFRTQISLKKLDGFKAIDEFSEGIVEFIALDTSLTKGKFIGYFNDTQHRNTAEAPILKVDELDLSRKELVDWANAVQISNGQTGMIMVKESHKCANQQGVHTGSFVVDTNTVSVTGAGLDSLHLSDEYQKCWANWSIVYKGDDADAKLALKQFDRKRYPIDPERDIYIMSNTWGSGSSGSNSKYASREENILKELEVSKELGLDLLQIDDGWQGTQYSKWQTVEKAVYKKPEVDAILADKKQYDVYPEGWKNVRQAAKEAGVKLGLWAAWTIPYEDLLKNYELGDFRSYKLDFAKLRKYKTLREFEDRVRQFIIATNHKVRVNWDVTENPPRIGYYFGREYGNIYLENRKPMTPVNVVYHPWLVLRDAWHVAKYTNLNKFQITYQNVDMVNREVSDASKYTHDFALAITLMGSPIFFQEIHLLSEEAKSTIKPLINTYKSVRDEMYKGYVFAIGEEPANSSFTGFQNFNPETKSGYLMLYKELNCNEDKYSFKLNFLEGKDLVFKNMMTGENWIQKDFSEFRVDMMNPGSFRFIQYKVN